MPIGHVFEGLIAPGANFIQSKAVIVAESNQSEFEEQGQFISRATGDLDLPKLRFYRVVAE
jgi:hypothetical protein